MMKSVLLLVVVALAAQAMLTMASNAEFSEFSDSDSSDVPPTPMPPTPPWATPIPTPSTTSAAGGGNNGQAAGSNPGHKNKNSTPVAIIIGFTAAILVLVILVALVVKFVLLTKKEQEVRSPVGDDAPTDEASPMLRGHHLCNLQGAERDAARSRIHAFYARHNPTQMDKVEVAMKRNQTEAEVMAALSAKYAGGSGYVAPTVGGTTRPNLLCNLKGADRDLARGRIEAFYKERNPTQMDKVEGAMARDMTEDELMTALNAKYPVASTAGGEKTTSSEPAAAATPPPQPAASETTTSVPTTDEPAKTTSTSTPPPQQEDASQLYGVQADE